MDRGNNTSRTVGSTGSPRCSPFFPGVTPPTMLVPHAIDSFAFAVAWEISADIAGKLQKELTCLPGHLVS